MSDKTASRERVLIAVVDAAGEEGLDRLQLQKAVFLVGEELKDRLPDDFYQFRPHLYGPFAQEVYVDIERLSDGPVVEVVAGNGRRGSYRLGQRGIAGLSHLSEDLASGIGRIVAWVTRMSFDELVRAVYHLYPEQKDNSVFQGYSEERAQAESFQRAFSEIAAGGGRPALELVGELQETTAFE